MDTTRVSSSAAHHTDHFDSTRVIIDNWSDFTQTEAYRVIVDNMPTSNWTETWSPIIIAAIAVILSLFSMYWSRVEMRQNSRPYIWAANWVINGAHANNLMGIKVKNNPAFIFSRTVRIMLDDQVLHTDHRTSYVMFPDDASHWTAGMDRIPFQQMMNNLGPNVARLKRHVEIQYGILDQGSRRYQFSMEQTFDPVTNQWDDGAVTAD